MSITDDFMSTHPNGAKLFAIWYINNNIESNTSIPLAAFTKLSFSIQLGILLNWLNSNGVFLYCDADKVCLYSYVKDNNKNPHFRVGINTYTKQNISKYEFNIAFIERAIVKYFELLEIPF